MYSNHTFHTNQIQTLNKAKHHSVNTTCRMKPFESAQTGCAGFFFLPIRNGVENPPTRLKLALRRSSFGAHLVAEQPAPPLITPNKKHKRNRLTSE